MLAAEVRLWGVRIGIVAYDEKDDSYSFKYDPSFLASKIQLSPIVMPLSDQPYSFKSLSFETFKGLPGMLADSLPDRFGDAVINAWLASNNKDASSFNSIERLCLVGIRGMGALEFFPYKSFKLDASSLINIENLVSLSDQILRQKQTNVVYDAKGLEEILTVGTSAGGMRAKAIIAYNEKTNQIKSGQVDAGVGFEYWLIKFDDTSNNEQYTKIEYAYYLMATKAGINMSECRQYILAGKYHFMTKRFDRIIKDDKKVDKLHMQTLGALMHIDYNIPALFSYEETAKVMNMLNLSKEEIKQFYRRMVFNVIARNQDDHVKNISFLMDRKGKWYLSPAYDITFAYNPFGAYTNNHQMFISGKLSDFTLADLLSSAKAMNISKQDALITISEVNDAIKQWSSFAKEASLDQNVSAKIEGLFRKIVV